MSFTIQSVYQDQFLELMNEFDLNYVDLMVTVAGPLRDIRLPIEISWIGWGQQASISKIFLTTKLASPVSIKYHV